ncbi:hypothetical protein EAI_14341, partial [Harpegnathos saltator]
LKELNWELLLHSP